MPVAPWRLAESAAAAVEAAAAIGYPVAVKLASPDVEHKMDVGGVILNVPDDAGVADAFERVTAAGAAVAGARVDGATITSMRTGGVELIVGVVRDDDWGPLLAVGLGGVWVNALDDKSLRPLPVDHDGVLDMLAELRGAALLRGERGTTPVDTEALVEVIQSISRHGRGPRRSA